MDDKLGHDFGDLIDDLARKIAVPEGSVVVKKAELDARDKKSLEVLDRIVEQAKILEQLRQQNKRLRNQNLEPLVRQLRRWAAGIVVIGAVGAGGYFVYNNTREEYGTFVTADNGSEINFWDNTYVVGKSKGYAGIYLYDVAENDPKMILTDAPYFGLGASRFGQDTTFPFAIGEVIHPCGLLIEKYTEGLKIEDDNDSGTRYGFDLWASSDAFLPGKHNPERCRKIIEAREKSPSFAAAYKNIKEEEIKEIADVAVRLVSEKIGVEINSLKNRIEDLNKQLSRSDSEKRTLQQAKESLESRLREIEASQKLPAESPPSQRPPAQPEKPFELWDYVFQVVDYEDKGSRGLFDGVFSELKPSYYEIQCLMIDKTDANRQYGTIKFLVSESDVHHREFENRGNILKKGLLLQISKEKSLEKKLSYIKRGEKLYEVPEGIINTK